MYGWKVRCMVRGASRADIEQWLAHHATGKYAVFTVELEIVTIELELMEDRLLLREAFDIAKMVFDT
jgi:hypothetical protein